MVDSTQLEEYLLTGKNKPKCAFSKNILKLHVGDERAKNAFNSISMTVLPGGKLDKDDMTLGSKFYPR